MLQKVDAVRQGETNLLTGFFDGTCQGKGIVIDRLGRVRDRILVTMEGGWEKDVFKLAETFSHEDGRTEWREWSVVPDAAGLNSFVAACPDMKSPAKGVFTSSSVRMAYRFPVPIAGRKVTVSFDDRMYRIDETCLFERASMHLLGIRIADIYLNFEKIK